MTTLEDQGFLTASQVISLEGAMEVSKELYSGIMRRNQLVSHINGHINPGLQTIIDNHETYTDYVVQDYDRNQFPEDLRYFDKNNIRASALYELLLTYIGHDWYEDFEGSVEELEEIREKQIVTRFGKRLDRNILVISKTGNIKTYVDAMGTLGSRAILAAKSVDRCTNLRDDFGSLDHNRNIAYVHETKQHLMPLFRLFKVPFYSDMEELVGDLETDIVQRQYAEDISMKNFVYDFDSDRRTDWREHLEWMVNFLTAHPDMPSTMGGKIGVLMHDLTDEHDLIITFLRQMGVGVENTPFGPEKDWKGEESWEMPTSPDLAFYATGIAISSSKYDEWSARRRKDPNSYLHIENLNIRSTIEEINDPMNKAEWSFSDLKESGLLRYAANPIVSMEEIMEILEWDIEGMLISVAEKLHNLQNPPLLQGGESNAAYQWKAAQEILSCIPLLEIGGLRSLAQYAEGKVNEFLYADLLEAEPWIREEYDRIVEFYGIYGGRIQRALNSIPLITPYTGVVAMNLKSFGSFLKKIYLQREEYKDEIKPSDIKIGDAIRCNIIFSGPNDIRGSITMDSLLGMYSILSEECLSSLNSSIPQMVFSNEHPLKGDPIVVRAPQEDYTSVSAYVLNSLNHRHKETNSFKGIQHYIKVVPKYPSDPSADSTIYIEVQAVSTTDHYNNTVGPESHLEYTLRDKFKMKTSQLDLQTFTEAVSQRVSHYRVSPRNAMYLSARSREELVKRGYCDESDLKRLRKPELAITDQKLLERLIFIG